MIMFMKGTDPTVIVSTAPVDGSFFSEERFAIEYERYGGFYVCKCDRSAIDTLLHRLNAFEQISAFATQIEKPVINLDSQEYLAS